MKSQFVNVRCTPKQKATAIALSNACGLSVSAFVKRRAFGRRTPVALPKTYRSFNREIHAVENNLEQIARVARAQDLPREKRFSDVAAEVRRRVIIVQMRIGRR